MFDKLINQSAEPVLEKLLQFTSARHKLIGENVANISTPNFQQRDLSLEKFQEMLGERISQRDHAGRGETSFDDISTDIDHPSGGILFHDGTNRSMEQLMSDQAKNALMHNFVVELLRKQYQTMELSLKDRPG